MKQYFSDTTIYAAIWTCVGAISLWAVKVIITIVQTLISNRGSSEETKNSLERLESDNAKRFEELKLSINNNNKELKDLINSSIEKLATKEYVDLKMQNLRDEVGNKIKIDFVKLENLVAKSLDHADRQTLEARNMKDRLIKVFGPLAESLKNADGQVQKEIAEETKTILEDHE